MNEHPRIEATPAAHTLISALKEQHGPLMFHQSGGCCDGSSPMCFADGDFKVGYSDVGIGYVGGMPFWMSKDQFAYWQHTILTLDVVAGRGSSFSLEIPTGFRFIIRSRVSTESEIKNLAPLFFKQDN